MAPILPQLPLLAPVSFPAPARPSKVLQPPVLCRWQAVSMEHLLTYTSQTLHVPMMPTLVLVIEEEKILLPLDFSKSPLHLLFLLLPHPILPSDDPWLLQCTVSTVAFHHCTDPLMFCVSPVMRCAVHNVSQCLLFQQSPITNHPSAPPRPQPCTSLQPTAKGSSLHLRAGLSNKWTLFFCCKG